MNSRPAEQFALRISQDVNPAQCTAEPHEDYANDDLPQRLTDRAAAVLLTVEGTVIRANEALAILLRCRPGSLHERSFLEFVPPVYHPACRRGLSDVAGGAMRDFLLTIVDGDGQRRIVSLVCMPSSDLAGTRQAGVFGLVRDITAQHLERRRNAMARRALEHTLEAIAVLDRQLRLIFANGAFTRITGYHDHELAGQTPDYLFSDNHEKATYAAIAQALTSSGQWRGELWCRRRNGDTFPSLQSFAGIRNKHGNITHYVHCFNDISQHKDYERRLAYLAHRDPVTHLPNRSLFIERCTAALNHAGRTGKRVAVLFIDLDRFKAVNDKYGHHAGDLLLQAVAERLTAGVRATDTVARFGGDEFVVLLENISHPAEASTVTEKLLETLTRPLLCGDRLVRIGASIGISCHPESGDHADTLLRQADAAMYRAKKSGQPGYRFSHERPRAAVQPLSKKRLCQALANDELSLRFVPIARFSQPDRIIGVVPQAHWHPAGGATLTASQLQQAAVRLGLAPALDAWLFDTAFCQLGALIVPRTLTIWACLTPARSGQHNTLLKRVSDFCHPRFDVTVLIPQAAIMEHASATRQIVRALADNGAGVGLAEFGSDPLPISQIADLPLRNAMLARELYTKRAGENAHKRLLAAVKLANALGIQAMGIEGGEQARATLSSAGCQIGRAATVNKPLNAQQLATRLRAG